MIYRNAFFLLASVFSVNTLATTIDYRHEFKDTAKADHKDRISFSNRFDNGFGLSAEARWGQHSSNTTPNRPYSDMVSNGTEVVASYLYKFNKQISLESGVSVDSNSEYNSYRPYLRPGVTFNDDFSATVRYRPYYKRLSGNIDTQKNTKETGYNLTSVVTYKITPNIAVEYEFDYQKATSASSKLSDNKNYSISHDIKLSYKWDKNWKPYFQLGNVPESSTSDNRQTRYRLGIQYNF